MIILSLTKFLLLTRQILENHFTHFLALYQVLVSNLVIPIRIVANQPPGENKGHSSLSQAICNYCKQSCHIVSDCPVLKRKREKQEGLKLTGHTSLKLTLQSCLKDQHPARPKVPETDSVMEIYEPLSDRFVSLNSDFAQSTPITILRYTGVFNSLVWQILCHFPTRLLLEQVFLFRV